MVWVYAEFFYQSFNRMKIITWTAFLFFISNHFYAQSQMLKAGAFAVNITPSRPVPLSGYAGRAQPSTGVHDSIYARAFVFDDGQTRACLIQADLIGFSFEFAEEINQEVEKNTGIPKQNSFLVAAHNHGAPSTRAYGESATENLALYLSELKSKLVDAAVRAWGSRVPVNTAYGEGSCRMNINRRARHSEGGIWLGRNPDGPCDHTVGVLRLDNMNGETIALLVNWPCHATVNGQENSLVTGDWPGSTVRYLEKNYKAGIPIGMFAGASGDINPVYGPHKNFGEMDAIGLILGEEIVKITSALSPQPAGKLAVLSQELTLPGKQRSTGRMMPNESLLPGDSVKLRLSVIKIGTLALTGISGELMTEIGMEIKNNSPFRQTQVITHCNGNSGYLCTDAAYREGGYEPMVSRTMPGIGRIIVDKIVKMLNSLY